MKLIIAGSRTATMEDVCLAFIDSGIDIGDVDEIVSGAAPGADSWGEKLAKVFDIKVKRFPANWAEYGNRAGPLRNQEMADYGDQLLLCWDGVSSGSKDMLKRAKAKGLPNHVFLINQ